MPMQPIEHKLLICDDVYTTGTSFKDYCEEHKHDDVYKWVLFARCMAKDLKYGVRAFYHASNMINDVMKWLIGGSSITLAIVYTIGHMLIAIACVMIITGASIELATLDAIVEPLINGVWFYVLHETWKKFQK